MPRRSRELAQLSLPAPRTHGGKRKGAGRPRLHDKGIAHRRRPSVSPRVPLHVTLRMERRVWNLRSQRSFRIIEKALFAASNGKDAQVVHFSVQGNHIHMLVEADNKRALSRAMRSLCIRIGRGMNALMGSSGRVLAHRYHTRSLCTPTEVFRALGYVRHNFRKHQAERGHSVPADFVDPYSSDALLSFAPPRPRTWLLDVGWRRCPAARQPDFMIAGGEIFKVAFLVRGSDAATNEVGERGGRYFHLPLRYWGSEATG